MDINKEEVKRILAIEGEVRGMTLKTDENYILKHFGKEGVERVEKEFENLEHSLSYEKINSMEYYPLGMRILSLIAMQRALDLTDEQIKDVGMSAPRASLLIKFFMKYFLSIQKTFEKAGDMWGKHYTVGKLDPVYVNEEERKVVLQLTGVEIHPIYCTYLIGYFSSVGKMVIQKEADVEESKCSFRGDELHEFILRW